MVAASTATFGSPPKLNPPASPDLIEQRLARALGLAIPVQLSDSLLVHNGVEKGESLTIHQSKNSWQAIVPLDVETIEHLWNQDREAQAEAELEAGLEKTEVPSWVTKPEWIPFFTDGGIGDFTIYLDSTNGTVLHYCKAANPEVDRYRYQDLAAFLRVIVKHVEQNQWFEWGNEVDSANAGHPLFLNTKEIKKLVKARKSHAFIESNDNVNNASIQIEDALTEKFNAILSTLAPVKSVRTPAQPNFDYVICFTEDDREYRIFVSVGEGTLVYSLGNCQYTGGDPSSFRRLVTELNW